MPGKPLIPYSRVVIATHELFYGAPQALRDYLIHRGLKALLFISHPILPENPASYVTLSENGNITRTLKRTRTDQGTVLSYPFDIALTFYWVIFSGVRCDTFIGVDPLNCLTGILLKKTGFVKNVIFYAIDFVPRRFSNNLLNTIYHWMEKIAVISSDECWNVSPGIALGRKKYLGIDPSIYTQNIVPIGVWKKDIVKYRENHSNMIVFTGHLLKKQGVQLFISAIPEIRRQVKDVTAVIIGSGEYESTLVKLVKTLHLESIVQFVGWVSDPSKERLILSKAALAVAPYIPDGKSEGNFTYYADPTKLKTYLSNGLPVVMTNVPHNADELSRKKCAVVIPYDRMVFANVVAGLLIDRTTLNTYRKNALSYANGFTWERIFSNVLERKDS